jgi:oxalate decarboxylase/phosphoglucose isomerase-like protein (cupin superfamily)
LEIAVKNGGKMNDLPFKEKFILENNSFIEVIREFDKKLGSKELIWHRDKEDRVISLIKGSGWYLQIENELPKEITANKTYNINKNVWHRIINKNGNNLVILLRKYK